MDSIEWHGVGPMTGVVEVTVPWHQALPKSGAYWCYRIFDADGEIVYVGSTAALRDRMRANARRFGARAARVEWKAFRDRRSAEAEERDLIARLNPPMNVAAGTGRFGDR